AGRRRYDDRLRSRRLARAAGPRATDIGRAAERRRPVRAAAGRGRPGNRLGGRPTLRCRHSRRDGGLLARADRRTLLAGRIRAMNTVAAADIRLKCQPGKEGNLLTFSYEVANQGPADAYVMDAIASIDSASGSVKSNPKSVVVLAGPAEDVI